MMGVAVYCACPACGSRADTTVYADDWSEAYPDVSLCGLSPVDFRDLASVLRMDVRQMVALRHGLLRRSFVCRNDDCPKYGKYGNYFNLLTNYEQTLRETAARELFGPLMPVQEGAK